METCKENELSSMFIFIYGYLTFIYNMRSIITSLLFAQKEDSSHGQAEGK